MAYMGYRMWYCEQPSRILKKLQSPESPASSFWRKYCRGLYIYHRNYESQKIRRNARVSTSQFGKSVRWQTLEGRSFDTSLLWLMGVQFGSRIAWLHSIFVSCTDMLEFSRQRIRWGETTAYMKYESENSVYIYIYIYTYVASYRRYLVCRSKHHSRPLH